MDFRLRKGVKICKNAKKRNRLTIRKGWVNTQVNMALTKTSGVEGVITRYCTLYLFVCSGAQSAGITILMAAFLMPLPCLKLWWFRKWRGNTDSRCVFEAKNGKVLS